ncbi:uncharacterized protein RCH25_007354 [Pelodytes ibericus]
MATFNLAQQDDYVPALPRALLGGTGNGRGACRSLFGPIDHDELRSDLKRQLKEIQASDCQRWNFDFDAGTPLKGIFCWEPLESQAMPSFYRESRVCPAQVPRQLDPSSRIPVPSAESSEEAQQAMGSQSPDCAKENAEKTIRRCQGVKVPTKTSPHITIQLRKKEISTTITDYFPKRKRTSVLKPDSIKGTHPFCTLEQTPRKKIR